MTRKAKIISVCISFLLAMFSWWRLTYVVQRRSFESNFYAILIVLSAVVILVLAYSQLIKRFSKDHIVKKNYAVLYDLEAKQHTGEIEFYFSLDEPKSIAFSILNDKMSELFVVKEGNFESGGHIVRYDTAQLENGYYFYCLQTDNQKTMKKLLVLHDNVTA